MWCDTAATILAYGVFWCQLLKSFMVWWSQGGNDLKLRAVIKDMPCINNIRDLVHGSTYVIKHKFEIKLGQGWPICRWRYTTYLSQMDTAIPTAHLETHT